MVVLLDGKKIGHAYSSRTVEGDKVVTHSGMIGKLVEVGERSYKLEIAPGVKIDVLKSSIAGKDGADAATTDKK